MNNQSFQYMNASFQNKHSKQYSLTTHNNKKKNLKLKLFPKKKQLLNDSKDSNIEKPILYDNNLITKQFNFQQPSNPKPISRNFSSFKRNITSITKKQQKETINCENQKHLKHSNTKSFTPPPQNLLNNQFISKSTIDTESNNSISFKLNQEKYFKLIFALKRQIKFQNDKLNEKDKEIEELKRNANQPIEYSNLKLENEILHDELEKLKCELLERNQNEDNEKINDELISALKKELNSIKANIYVINEKYQSETIRNEQLKEQLEITNKTLLECKKEGEIETYKEKIKQLEKENALLKSINEELKANSQNNIILPEQIILMSDKERNNLIKILQMIYYEHDKESTLNEFIQNYYIENSYTNYVNNFCKCFGICDKCLIGRWVYFNKQIKNNNFIEEIKSEDYENANDTEIIVDTIKKKNQKLKNVYLSCEMLDLNKSGNINYDLFNIITSKYLNQSESNNLIKCIIKHTNYDENQTSVFDIKYSLIQKWFIFDDDDDENVIEEQFEEVEEEKEVETEEKISSEELYDDLFEYITKNALSIEELLKVFPFTQRIIPIDTFSKYLNLLGIIDKSVKIQYDCKCLDEKGNNINKQIFINLYYQQTSLDYKQIKQEKYLTDQVNQLIEDLFKRAKEDENLDRFQNSTKLVTEIFNNVLNK